MPALLSIGLDYFTREWSDFVDITIFDRTVGNLKKVPYPMHDNRMPIAPGGIRGFLERRGLIWECECARLEDRSCGIRFTQRSGRYVGICTHDPPQCGLFLDFSTLWFTSTKRSFYAKYPTLYAIENGFTKASSAPDLRYRKTLLGGRVGPICRRRSEAHYFSRLDPLARPLEMARGRRSFPQALGSSPLPGNQLALRRRESISPPRAIASSSSSKSASSDETSTSESILHRLLNGEGITSFEKMDLIEQCDSCAKHYLNVHLRSHIKDCAGYSDDGAALAGFDSD